MTASTPLRAAAIAAALALPATPGFTGETASPQQRLDAAMADHERGHWQAAFDAWAALADAGHAGPARLALLMSRHGPSLYRIHFGVAPGRRQLWLTAALSDPALAPGPIADASTPRTRRKPLQMRSNHDHR